MHDPDKQRWPQSFEDLGIKSPLAVSFARYLLRSKCKGLSHDIACFDRLTGVQRQTADACIRLLQIAGKGAPTSHLRDEDEFHVDFLKEADAGSLDRAIYDVGDRHNIFDLMEYSNRSPFEAQTIVSLHGLEEDDQDLYNAKVHVAQTFKPDEADLILEDDSMLRDHLTRRVAGYIAFERNSIGVKVKAIGVIPELRGYGHGEALLAQAVHQLGCKFGDEGKKPVGLLLENCAE